MSKEFGESTFWAKYGPGGKNILLPGDTSVPAVVIPTGILAVDMVTGEGGFRVGDIVLLSGDPNTGKSTICHRVAAYAIRRLGMRVLYHDGETRFSSVIAAANGVPVEQHDNFWLSQWEQPSEALSDEAAANTMNGKLQDLIRMISDLAADPVTKEKGAVVIIDSINALMTTQRQQSEAGRAQIANVARILSDWMFELSSLAKKSNMLIIFTQQFRDKIGTMVMPGSTSKPGGRAIQFYASMWIEFKSTKKEAAPKDSIFERTGTWVTAVNKKNTGGFFGIQSTYLMSVMYGPDDVRDIMTFGKAVNLITASGAFYSLPEVETKLQGVEQVRKYLYANPKYMARLKRLIREAMISRPKKTEGEANESDGTVVQVSEFNPPAVDSNVVIGGVSPDEDRIEDPEIPDDPFGDLENDD